jgi:hypothetical protein
MQFNVAKCKVIHFGRNNPLYEYEMLGQKLGEVESERDIGVTVNKNLKPSSQCAKAAGTARTVLGQISRSFHYRDKKTFVKLFVTYVRPHLEFCTPAWSPWTRADIDCLESVQRKMVGMVSGLSATTYEGRLAELGLESLEKRRKNADIYTMHKLVHGVGDIDISDWFGQNTGAAVTRARADLLNVLSKNGTLELRRNFFTLTQLPMNGTKCRLKLKTFRFQVNLRRRSPDGSWARARQLRAAPRRGPKHAPDRHEPTTPTFFKWTAWPMKNQHTSTSKAPRRWPSGSYTWPP